MQRRGFTLIELLVVVAIIALLIAILMPSLQRASGIAKMAACMSNQRQFTIASTSYATEHYGRLVGPHCNADIAHAWTTPNRTPAGNPPETPEEIQQGALWRYVKNIELYLCPVERRVNYIRSYSFNMTIGGIHYSGIAPDLNISSIRHPARRFLLLDDADPRGRNLGAFGLYPADHPTNSQRWLDYPAFYHLNAFNVHGFVDGHVISYEAQRDSTREISSFFHVDPNNPDLQYFQSIYSP